MGGIPKVVAVDEVTAIGIEETLTAGAVTVDVTGTVVTAVTTGSGGSVSTGADVTGPTVNAVTAGMGSEAAVVVAATAPCNRAGSGGT